jgi:hypothetical protein
MNIAVACYDYISVSTPAGLDPIARAHINRIGSRAFIVKVPDPSDLTGHHYVTIALASYGAAMLRADIASVCSIPSIPPPSGGQPFLVVDPNNPRFSKDLAPNANYRLQNKHQLYMPKAVPNPNSDCLAVCKALAAAIILYDISLDDIRNLNHRAFLLICNQVSVVMQLPAEVAGNSRPHEMDSPDLTVRIQALAPHLVRRFIHKELKRMSDVLIAFSEEEWDLGPDDDTEVLHRVIDHLRLPAMKVPEVEAMMLPRALSMMVRRGRMQ